MKMLAGAGSCAIRKENGRSWQGSDLVRELFLNGSDWHCKDDVYNDFFQAVGAPEWHGRNLDALNDSIGAGSINQIDVPYKLVVMNFDHVGTDALAMARDFADLIRDLRAKGCPVEIELRSSSGELLS